MKPNLPEPNVTKNKRFRYLSSLDVFAPINAANSPQTLRFTEDECIKLCVMLPHERINTLLDIVNTLINHGWPITTDLCEDFSEIHPGLADILQQSMTPDNRSDLETTHSEMPSTVEFNEEPIEVNPSKRAKTNDHHAFHSSQSQTNAQPSVITNPESIHNNTHNIMPHPWGFFNPNDIKRIENSIKDDLLELQYTLVSSHGIRDFEHYQNNREGILRVIKCFNYLKSQNTGRGRIIDFTQELIGCGLRKEVKPMQLCTQPHDQYTKMQASKFCLKVIPKDEVREVNFEFYNFSQSPQIVVNLFEQKNLIRNAETNKKISLSYFIEKLKSQYQMRP